jgi:Tol biopolymer transport system component/DNA-binding winged helix-turn-helix (wHTH) protein
MSGETPIRQIRRFGIFEVDLRRRELLRNGLQIKLRDQSFLLLAALLEQPGELVTREELRSKLWPDGTFVDFDHSLNAAIKRLRDALGDDPETPRFIETVPKRGYRFLAPVDDSSMRQVKTSGRRSMVGTAASLFRFRVLAGVVFLSVIVVGLGAIRYGPRSRTQLARLPLRVVPLTTYPGAEFSPAFSGDGGQVAFVWDGNTLDKTDIYVKRIGIDPPLKLTRSDGLVCCPAWTSDSRYIGFERCSGENQGIYLVPSLGGPERKLGNTPGCNGISWSPNEQVLAFSGKKSPDSPWALFLMSLDDMQAHQLTFPSADLIGDQDPVFSPDGKFLAFIRIVGEGTPDIYIAPVSGGPVRRLTYDKTALAGITWTSDGQKLVFSSYRGGSASLWVIPVRGGEPKRLPLGGAEASGPAISRQGNRLSYTQGDIHPNLWVIPISGGAAMRNSEAKPFFSSATYNNAPRFSPDGKKIAFASRRSGDMEIWTCDAADCSEPLQLTFLKSLTGTPRWSSDSKRISFESRPQGHSQIFVVSAGGGKPLPITDGTAEDKVTTWSPDGSFIYFASNRSGVSQIWKISASGGQPSQVTRKGGFASFASSDGKFLYYVKDNENGIWRMPTTGGDEIAVLPRFPAEHWGDWALVDKGIYYVDEVGHPTIKFLNFVNHKVTKIVEVESLPPLGDPGFTVSLDEKQIVFSQIDRSAVDLMLVENFNVEP